MTLALERRLTSVKCRRRIHLLQAGTYGRAVCGLWPLRWWNEEDVEAGHLNHLQVCTHCERKDPR